MEHLSLRSSRRAFIGQAAGMGAVAALGPIDMINASFTVPRLRASLS